MARQIFIVDALIVDSNGTFNHITDYPKRFDSNSYGGDIAKTRRRAEGDMSTTWGQMCLVDTRKVQTVTLSTVEGFFLESKTTGWEAEPEVADE